MLKIINKLILTSLIYCAGCYFTTSLWAVEIQVNITDINASNIKDIIVTATPEKLKPSEPLPAIIINQINKAFFPYLSVIRKGQKVIFKNNDDITHHIFSTSRIQNFAFKIRAEQEYNSVKFEQVGNIPMGCNIHDWMSGHVLVVDTPYFKKTDSQGNVVFSINHSDTFRVKIWHPQLNERDIDREKIIQLSDKNVQVNFQLKRQLNEIPTQKSDDDFDFLDDY